jgi:hypothetical protein
MPAPALLEELIFQAGSARFMVRLLRTRPYADDGLRPTGRWVDFRSFSPLAREAAQAPD